MPESALLKSFLSLVLLVAVLGIILLLIKRIVRKTKQKKQNSELSILTRMSLSPKAHLYIVQAENKKLLLGVTDHHVSLVHDYSKPNQLPDLINSDDSTAITKEMLKQKPIKTDDQSLSFGNFLKTAFKKG
ncbi:MAG: flagellar biosynthetic protein FliO [Ignavibacteria bacterium GWB2_35_12]|nr:MAG: flagellar biosynthetic protein FliO [Ignavibacteria bacterium GWB2_35_12]OGU95877.1 MAG: flagellar biosynthetic protein FliO [Ignavibacteria bacterium RIFOXYA2_FULL_35_10]OGV20645.1 MAG: flagellar biosynthetic protein FliO [Ignavibacteria bacterium RIFOXYC2_FULL_35_21]